ncbi:RIP metalloprotease RseP [Bacteroidota bacterium]
MDVFIMAAQMILGLSIIVGLHEFGHMITAKLFGMRVEQFSIGFPPKIFKIRKGETEYSIGAIPLGGFVKISGMIDESMDLDKMKEEPKPFEFRSKPAWQRLIVMMGGIIMNVITGIVVFIFLIFLYGESYISRDEGNEYGIVAYEAAQEIGLKTWDKIIRINGQEYEKFKDVLDPELLLEDDAYYTIERDGRQIDIPIPGNFIEAFNPKKGQESARIISNIYKFDIDRIVKKSGADSAGLQAGDIILSINSTKTEFFHQVTESLEASAGQVVTIELERSEQILTKLVRVSEDGTIGFYANPLYEISQIQYSFLEAIPKGTQNAFVVLFVQTKAFGKIITGQINFRNSISGPIGIAKVFGAQWDWYNFWRLVGLLSMILAFMNFLPIPALDGGHVMFLTFEIVSGRKPSDKFMEVAQKVGMVLLLGLMVFVIFNDIIKEIL